MKKGHHLRLNNELENHIDTQAHNHGISKTEYIRKLIYQDMNNNSDFIAPDFNGLMAHLRAYIAYGLKLNELNTPNEHKTAFENVYQDRISKQKKPI